MNAPEHPKLDTADKMLNAIDQCIKSDDQRGMMLSLLMCAQSQAFEAGALHERVLRKTDPKRDVKGAGVSDDIALVGFGFPPASDRATICGGFVASGCGESEPDAWSKFVSDLSAKLSAVDGYKFWRREPRLDFERDFCSDIVEYRYTARITVTDRPVDAYETASLDGIEKYRRRQE